MPNIAQVLKEEIRRIAKSQAKALTTDLKKDVVKLKKTVAEQKRRLACLERDNAWLVKAEKRRIEEQPTMIPTKESKARYSSKGIRSLRKKLGLSQTDFSRLVGVSAISIWQWEQKKGALNLRDKTKAALLAIRGIGAREAKRRLEVKGK